MNIRTGLLMLLMSPTVLLPATNQLSGINSSKPELIRAENLYRHTDYQDAIKLLAGKPDKDAETIALIGRCYLMLGDYKKATDLLEKAVEEDPDNSMFHLWLGRVYGRRAETSFPVNAVGWATKSRNSLEKAAQLNPRNTEAIDDLFDFYLQAPGILGGGLEKAEKLAEIIGKRDAAEGMYDQARIAEARKDYGAAEEYLKRAMQLAPHQVGRLLDLAKFLAKRGRFEESDQTFSRAENVAPDHPKVLFVQASTYIKANRNVDKAKALLERYLIATNLTPDDPPKSEAARLLKKVSGS